MQPHGDQVPPPVEGGYDQAKWFNHLIQKKKKNPLKSKINLLSLQITQNTEAIFPPLTEYITIFAALWA